MNLPNPDKAEIAREKIHGYLLSPVHPVGRHKAVFFQTLGYRQDQWHVLQSDLRAFAAYDARRSEQTEYGVKYEIRGVITGPDGRTADIVTAWIVLNGKGFAEFITAYPER